MTEIAALRDAINDCRKDVRGYAARVDEHHGEMQRAMGSLTECRRKVDEHEVTLDGPPGNGDKPGLRMRVTRLEDRSKSRVDTLKSHSRKRMAAIMVLVGLVSSIVGGVAVGWISSL